MSHQGSCHCGAVRYEVEGSFDQVIECNCSHCSRKGYLLWFVPKSAVKLQAAEGTLGTYTFNRHVIQHHFCTRCGSAPLGFGKGPDGSEMAAVNIRCLEGVDLQAVKRLPFDGRSM